MAGAWIFIAVVLLVGSVVGRRNFRLQSWFLLLFLLAVFLATLPLERLLGGLLAITSIVLTAYSVSLHDRVSKEIEGFIPIFDKMKSGAKILPLVRTSPSAHLGEPERWIEQRGDYDYVITRGMSRRVHRQLDYYGVLLDSVGPWRVYKLR